MFLNSAQQMKGRLGQSCFCHRRWSFLCSWGERGRGLGLTPLWFSSLLPSLRFGAFETPTAGGLWRWGGGSLLWEDKTKQVSVPLGGLWLEKGSQSLGSDGCPAALPFGQYANHSRAAAVGSSGWLQLGGPGCWRRLSRAREGFRLRRPWFVCPSLLPSGVPKDARGKPLRWCRRERGIWRTSGIPFPFASRHPKASLQSRLCANLQRWVESEGSPPPRRDCQAPQPVLAALSPPSPAPFPLAPPCRLLPSCPFAGQPIRPGWGEAVEKPPVPCNFPQEGGGEGALQLPQCPCGQARQPGSLSTVAGVSPPPNGVSEGGLGRRALLNPSSAGSIWQSLPGYNRDALSRELGNGGPTPQPCEGRTKAASRGSRVAQARLSRKRLAGFCKAHLLTRTGASGGVQHQLSQKESIWVCRARLCTQGNPQLCGGLFLPGSPSGGSQRPAGSLKTFRGKKICRAR